MNGDTLPTRILYHKNFDPAKKISFDVVFTGQRRKWKIQREATVT
jgi:hypothetical protein